jgi:S-DNA-T family DNA segregation ATPase FtsK/SpoIIIE
VRLRLNYLRQSGTDVDLEIQADPETTVGQLASAIATRDPADRRGPQALTLARYDEHGQPISATASQLLSESGIRSGSSIALAPDTSYRADQDQRVAAIVTIHSGPNAGRTIELGSGTATIGRDPMSDVVLNDPMVSTTHAKLSIAGDVIEIVDDNSSNGILLSGELVPRATLRTGDRVVLGDTVISVASPNTTIGVAPIASTVEFNRSPRVDPVFEGEELIPPDPPSPPNTQRFPLITAVAPLFMGAVLILVTRNPFSILFMLLSPIMLVGGHWENKRAGKKAFEEAIERFRANLADLVVRLRQATDEERTRRCIEHPGTADAVTAIAERNALLWTRRPEHASFMELRLGLGDQAARTRVAPNNSRNSTPQLQAELDGVVAQFVAVDRVPVVGSFERSGSFGVSGQPEARLSVARGLVLQLVGLHAPSEVVLCAAASGRSAGNWDWLKWLPHVGSDQSPLTVEHLAATEPAVANLVAELHQLVADRAAADDGHDREGKPVLPKVVVIVEDDAPVQRNRLVQLAEIGPAHGVHLVWVAGRTTDIPAACRSYLELDPSSGQAATGRVVEAELSRPVLVEPVDAASAERLAKSLAPVVDAGATVDEESDVPSRVSFLAEAGIDVAEHAASVVDRWRESNSLHQAGVTRRLKRDNTLRALVGRTAQDPLHLDLRTQGPHALVGGTTGAGKSEFLQSWVLGMAAAHSPQRVTFLFVDYKGGSAFADCVSLPHAVGLVTDLSPHLVQRALTSLNAELRYREHVLNRKRAKDLLELERLNDPDAPPSLVIVVDEFAALVQEVPEFVDGMVNVAQRGRSLGLHLILATQRPAGVIKDNLRANTNLRVALRMADDDDSRDVVGTTAAAAFDPELPGRALVRTGPGRLTLFQSAYAGGWTTDEPVLPGIEIRTLLFGTPQTWEESEDAVHIGADVDPGPPDIQRMVGTLRSAAELAGIEPPRRPWMPELARAYDLAELPNERRDAELVFGVVDLPEEQSQGTIAFRPDTDGNMAVFGTGGAGKSTLLRTLAVSAGLTARGGPCFVYGLDFGSRGLSMIDPLPHVGAVISADDTERTTRLMSSLRETIDERAARYAAVNAGTVTEYRHLADEPQEPRILLLLDGFAAFRTQYEVGLQSKVLDQLISIAADGRQVGVHLVLTADRVSAVPSALSSSIQRRIGLRLSEDHDESSLGIPKGGLTSASPPGRGFMGGAEIQVAVLGGRADSVAQASAIDRLAASMARAGSPEAPQIERLTDDVALSDLPALVHGLPTFGVGDTELQPVGFDPTGAFVVAGPSGSGRTTTVETLLTSALAARPGMTTVYVGNPRSRLASRSWHHAALNPADAAILADELNSTWSSTEPGPVVVVIEGIADLLNSDADYPLQDLLKTARLHGALLIADGEVNDLTGSWPLLQQIKASRRGIVLQPDQTDGDALFRVSFPRLSRADFPVGRGMYVAAGRFERVQVAQPTRPEGTRGSAPHVQSPAAPLG